MATSREERMQQRLRGAQRRDVKDVDFGLVFPTSTRQLAPTQGPDQPDLTPKLSNRKSPRRSVRDPQHSNSTDDGNPSPLTNSANDANTSAKRRKLEIVPAPPSAMTDSRSLNNLVEQDIYSLRENEMAESSASEIIAVSAEKMLDVDRMAKPDTIVAVSLRRSPRTPLNQVSPVEEIPKGINGSSHHKGTEISEAAMKPDLLQDLVQDGSPTEAARLPGLSGKKRKRGIVRPTILARNASAPQRSQVHQVDPTLVEIDELSPEQVIHHDRMAAASTGDHNSQDEHEEKDESFLGEGEKAEAINDEDAAAVLSKSLNRAISSKTQQKNETVQNDNMPKRVALSKKRRPKRIPSPVQQRQPRKSNSKASKQVSKKPVKKARMLEGSPIPVIVHRLTTRPHYNEDHSTADILNLEIPYAKRSSVNAVDVLSQICQEIVASGLDALEDGGNNAEDAALRREYRTKWLAVDAFGKELEGHLAEHAINLDNTYALERRVRDEEKKKIGLRDDILRIRAEREKIALSMDEIRIQHENDTTEAQERESLNTAFHDIELAIDRGRSKHAGGTVGVSVDLTGTELLLKRVADEVSTKSGAGGILKQLQDFNAFLERAAVALETRKL